VCVCVCVCEYVPCLCVCVYARARVVIETAGLGDPVAIYFTPVFMYLHF
jgi:hypothetical protein